jgi:hypothetical protein
MAIETALVRDHLLRNIQWDRILPVVYLPTGKVPAYCKRTPP